MDAFEQEVVKSVQYDGEPDRILGAWMSVIGRGFTPESLLAAIHQSTGTKPDNRSAIVFPSATEEEKLKCIIHNDAFSLVASFYKNDFSISELTARNKGCGIGTRVMANLIEIAYALGKNGISLSAMDVGGYVWPRMGFQQSEWCPHLAQDIRQRAGGVFEHQASPEARAYIEELTTRFSRHPRLPQKIASVPEEVTGKEGKKAALGYALLVNDEQFYPSMSSGLYSLYFPLNQGLKTKRALGKMRRYVEGFEGVASPRTP